MRLMERQPSRRLPLPLLLQQRRVALLVGVLLVRQPALVVVALAAEPVVVAVAAERVEPHVAQRQRLFPESGRNSLERL
jgi:hypothetical protein